MGNSLLSLMAKVILTKISMFYANVNWACIGEPFSVCMCSTEYISIQIWFIYVLSLRSKF